MHDKIVIIDFGSQLTQLIARRVREVGVYSEIVPVARAADALAAVRPKGVILSGGPASVVDPGAPLAPPLYPTSVLFVPGGGGAWTMRFSRDEAIARGPTKVGGGGVLCGLWGGVDSAVPAVLVHEAIGDQLTCVLVDHGLLRLGEADQVVALFRHSYNIPLIRVDAAPKFTAALAGIDDPERKRKIIGALFIDAFEAEAT